MPTIINKPKPTTQMVLASAVQEREVRFIWNPYVPIGGLTMLFGPGGIGKSWITCALAADLSAGRALPGHHGGGREQKVLIVSAEDSMGEVLVPRLRKMDANLANIGLVDESFTLDRDRVDWLANLMRDFAATVVFIDPLVAYMGGGLDLHRANETREFMDRLKAVAKQEQKGVVIVHHTRKTAEGSDADRALGSVDLTNSIRSGLFATRSKSGNKIIRHVKANWSAEGPTLAFTTEDNTFRWLGTDEGDAPSNITRQPRGTARAFLKSILKDGPKPAGQVVMQAAEVGISERTLNRAKLGLVTSRKVDGVWLWELIPQPAGGALN